MINSLRMLEFTDPQFRSRGVLWARKTFWDHVDKASKSDAEKKEVGQNENLSTDELLAKIILNQNTQTEALHKIRWAIIGLGNLHYWVTTIVLKMKLGL